MASTARDVADQALRQGAKLQARVIESQRKFFGESRSALEAAAESIIVSVSQEIEAYAEQVSRDRAEPLRHTIDTLRAANDVLRAQLAATQAERKEK